MSSKIEGGIEQIQRRVEDLERRLASAEADAEWDALEPELRALRSVIHRELGEDRTELESAKREYNQKYGPLAHLNPFNAGAREQWKTTVSRKQHALESDQSAEYAVDKLTEKFYADRTRKFARELIRVAEKIQRGIGGSWELKAGAAAGAILAQKSGEETLEQGRRAQEPLLRAGFLNEGSAMAAAVLSPLPAEEAVALGQRVRAAARGEHGEGAEAVEIAAMIAGRDHPRVRSLDQGGFIAAASLLTGREEDSVCKLARELGDVPANAPALARARVAAAALLSGRSVAEVKRYAEEMVELMRFDPEVGSMHIAAAILSPRTPEEAMQVVHEGTRAVHGGFEAEAAIISAAILSRRSPPESIAFAKHLQSAFTGTWESEAKIIGAAIIAYGFSGLDDARAQRVAGAFLMPGFLAPAEE